MWNCIPEGRYKLYGVSRFLIHPISSNPSFLHRVSNVLAQRLFHIAFIHTRLFECNILFLVVYACASWFYFFYFLCMTNGFPQPAIHIHGIVTLYLAQCYEKINVSLRLQVVCGTPKFHFHKIEHFLHTCRRVSKPK